jgi:FdhE protein
VCVSCGDSKTVAQQAIEGGAAAHRVETCDACKSYIKLLLQAEDPGVEPMADDLASLGLDMLAAEGGWSRTEGNPLVVMG